MKHGVALIVVLIALSAVDGGCGSGEPTQDKSESFTLRASTTMTTGALTKTQFVDRVDEICRHGEAVILDNFTEYSGSLNPKLSEREEFAKAIRLSFLAGLDFHVFDKIRRLRAPRGERTQVEQVIGEMQVAIEKGQRVLHAYSPAEVMEQFSAYNAAARRYGLKACLVNASRLRKALA